MFDARRWTWALALGAAALTIGLAAAAYRVVSGAFATEYEQRLAELGRLVASQLDAADIADARQFGVEGPGYLALQAQLDALVVTARLENVLIVDSAGLALYDVNDPEGSFGLPTRLDSVAAGPMREARGGRLALAAFRGAGGGPRVASLAPVGEPGRVAGVLVLVGEPGYGAVLARLGRTLALAAGFSLVAIAFLAWRLALATDGALELERRLARSENLAAMGRLTATLAHEIKNPLAILRGSAKRIGRAGPQALLADSMIEEVDRLSRTVNRYLQFARGESGAAGDGDATQALVATLDLLEGEFGTRSVVLERGLHGIPAPVPLDTESLKQVFLNLVLNALEATPAGGRVRVVLERDGADVRVVIEDSGAGIPAEVLARLGEPFVTTKAQGTGLGLFLARRFVRASGGTFTAGNLAGGGARVTLRWPVRAA